MANYSRVVTSPGRACRSMVVATALAKTTVLLSNACKTARFSPLVNWVDNPINAWIPADLKALNENHAMNVKMGTYSFMVRINENNFKVFINTILVYPVGVEYTKISASATNTLFSS